MTEFSSNFSSNTVEFFQPLKEFTVDVFEFMNPLVEAAEGASTLIGMFV